MRIVLLLILLFPLSVLADTKMDLARKIFIDSEFDESFEVQRKQLAEHKERTIDMLISTVGTDILSQNIIALNEQLILDLNSSNIFEMDKDEFEKLMLQQVIRTFTYDELLKLLDLYELPIFKKLTSVGKRMEHAATKFSSDWQDHNMKLVREFTNRSKEIGRLSFEYVKSQQEQNP
jgi:hypothetical protein